jgi:hypothetical protein
MSDPSTGSQAPEVVGICTTFTRRPPLASGTISVPRTIPYAIKLGVAFSLNHYTPRGPRSRQRSAYRERPGVRLRVAAPAADLRGERERAGGFAGAFAIFWRATGGVD